jgi:hypothetical protein
MAKRFPLLQFRPAALAGVFTIATAHILFHVGRSLRDSSIRNDLVERTKDEIVQTN